MEPIEESTTLSPKESIVNILGRLFNNGHISADELAMMQMELVARNPAPAEPSLGDIMRHGMFQDLLRNAIQANEQAERMRKAALSGPGILHPHGIGGSISNPYGNMGTLTRGDDLLNQARLSQYVNADTLTPIDLNGLTKF